MTEVDRSDLPEVQPLTLFYTIFERNGTPFRTPSRDKWYHFHIPSIENCIPFNCYKYNVFIKY